MPWRNPWGWVASRRLLTEESVYGSPELLRAETVVDQWRPQTSWALKTRKRGRRSHCLGPRLPYSSVDESDDEARKKARDVLDHRWTSSLSVTVSPCTLAAILSGSVLGGLVGTKTLPANALWAIPAAIVLVALVVFVGAELNRLSRTREALDELLRSGKFYEQLLDDARRERDKLKHEVMEARASAYLALSADLLSGPLSKEIVAGRKSEEEDDSSEN